MPADVIAFPLGEASRADVEAAIARQFGGATRPAWLDRNGLRRRPLTTLAHLLRQRYGVAVLVASDLRQPRLRLTSFVLGLARADSYWRIDLRGNREAWRLGAHFGRNVLPIARHLIACGLAGAFGEPVLRVIDRFLKPRTLRMQAPTRIVYLRSQLWLGLEAGGSVAHTAGVVRGLEQAGVTIHVVSSDHLPGVTAQTDIVPPETWFDGKLGEVEDLAYNVAFLTAALMAERRIRHCLPLGEDGGEGHVSARPAAGSERSDAGPTHRPGSQNDTSAIYQRHTTFNCSGSILSRLLRVPLVLEFNSSEVWKGRYWGGLRMARAAAIVERINLRAADRVVVVSRVLGEYVRSTGVPEEKILVNPNAVDPSQFRPDVDGSAVRQRLALQSSIVVGFSGTFGQWHGIPTLAEAVAGVCRARPNVRWLLVGDGPLRHLIDEAVQKNALADRVSLPGLVPHADMPAYLAACDVLVSPHGRQADGGEFFGSPTKLFEYMACGRAIVASAVGQIADVLQHEQSALLVPPEDPEALANAIVRLVDDASLRTRLGQAARQAAVERHTWRQNAERVLASFDA